jgi:hypothetical protein
MNPGGRRSETLTVSLVLPKWLKCKLAYQEVAWSHMDDATHGQSRTTYADTTAGSGWVTTEVAARALRVSSRTIRRYIERGELAAKTQGEGVNRAWLVSVDSLHALRTSRMDQEDTRGGGSDTVPENSIADALRDMAARIEERAAEAAELRAHLELTTRAQSTVEERLVEERLQRQEAEKERDDLRRRLDERPSWWGIALASCVGAAVAVALILIYLVLQ